MHRYFIEEKNNENFIFSPENIHHIKNVVKLKPKEQIVLIYKNTEFLVEILEISNDEILTKTISSKKVDFSKKCNVTLILGLIREQKWDFVLQKATELGATRIIPIEFKRNVVKIDEKKITAKIARWKKICEDASEQSHQIRIPEITPIIKNLNALNEMITCKTKLVAYENEKNNNFKQFLVPELKEVALVIGPEGGLEANEIKWFEENGYEVVSLGKNIFRAETAPLLFLSSIIYEYDL
ncbi:16S ribosomal RNA methyltransferase RsmE [Spiroplasma sabaudiense Ar-1343]|uniref:Ribosomal RNA small subunit methyltransferase E n=1 Tax=Spiroplasma sabaudiense Ar-1343 TaxID=1276257 RepID=W6A9W8_9MOLU|nr:RsmE family RNA methyltransferase [Spiroplasma sabaudiense]AHI53973.1 16S ribosomal RNA methyltransferase RsmE [Spiroplasma sabaudiense Ar-1343]